MVEKPAPKYLPGQWLRFKYGSGEMISKVTGATYINDKGWMYNFVNPSDPNQTVMSFEDGIISVVKAV